MARRAVGLGALAALAVVALLAASWVVQDGTDSTIDGWPVGSTGCNDRINLVGNVVTGRGRCADLLPAAQRALDSRDTGHAPVLAASLHQIAAIHYFGLNYVAVFRLMDGSLRAIGVGWLGVSTGPPDTAPWGPDFVDNRPVCAGGPGAAQPALHKACRGGPRP